MKWHLLQSTTLTTKKQFEEFVLKAFSALPADAVVQLSGELGAGKTEAVKIYLGQKGFAQVLSPTFTFQHVYSINGQKVQHWDLYRIKSEEDLESIGFWTSLENESNLSFVEWAPKDFLMQVPFSRKLFQLSLNFLGQTRKVEFSERTE